MEPLKLYWKEHFIGSVIEVVGSDFPWVYGRISIAIIPSDLKESLEYLHTQSLSEDGVTDWPFPEEFGLDWRMVRADGTTFDTCQPIINFDTNEIEWR